MSATAESAWLVTGAGRGLGRCIAQELLRRGHHVLATGRDPDRVHDVLAEHAAHGRLQVAQLDLDDPTGADRAVEVALRVFGRLDGLVNNAGYGLLGAVEEVSPEEMQAAFRTNVFGTHRMIRAALPALRDAGVGHIVNISSLGGFAASAGWGVYNATKFAVEGLSEALALELAPLGVRVLIVEPGSFRTGFLSSHSVRVADARIDAYSETAGRTRTIAAQRDGNQTGDPHRAAWAIVEAINAPNPPLRLVLGRDALRRVEDKLSSVRHDLDAWIELSSSTDLATT